MNQTKQKKRVEMGLPSYKVQRCRITTDKLYGAVHGSFDGNVTVCGKEIESNKWWIMHNTHPVDITCRECKKETSNQNKQKGE